MTTTPVTQRSAIVAASLKMYFGAAQTADWCDRFASSLGFQPLPGAGAVNVVVLPDFTSLAMAVTRLGPTGAWIGAQDLFWEERGPYTGEVGGAQLHELGCRFVEIGHSERRLLFHETDTIVARKLAAAWRNRLIPILCVGEPDPGPAAAASRECVRQLQDALAGHVPEQVAGPGPGPAREASLPRLVVAYEPVWAIGATQPAPVGHIQEVCAALRTWLAASGLGAVSRLMYGGSAGPGLLTELGLAVDGLFVGRRGLDPRGLVEVIAEAAARQHTPAGARRKGNQS